MEQKWVSFFHLTQAPNLHPLPLVLLLLLLLCINPSLCVDLHPQDKASLLLFRSWVQDPNRSLSSWVGSNCTAWDGLACDGRTGRVVAVDLTNMSLSGQIHPKFCTLLFLQYLVLTQNSFSTPIPSCFRSFHYLITLDLSHNRFHGSLPDELVRLRSLRELVLNGNGDLGGPVPWWVGNFSGNLERIDLGFNSFRGELPESLAQLKALKHLDLGYNNLSGKVIDFGQPLLFLNLGSNQFSGTLPCLSALAQSLTVFNLADNGIVGGIPTCIANLQALTHLNLSRNRLSYELSPRLVFSENLLVLDLSNNGLPGNLPREIAETTDKSGLVLLDLSYNRFSGEIPVKITELKSLQALFLSHNALTGEIPARIGNLTYLQVIDLSHNSLSGSIPLNIVGCFQLLALMLSNNNLSGEIQPELDALNSLKILDISNNRISGEIPLTLAGCKSLEVVDFSSNNLSGSLNDAMTKWLNLRFLSIARNKFHGDLPNWFFTFEEIQSMDFSGNRFTGFIPDGNFNNSLRFNSGEAMTDESLVADQNRDMKVSVLVTDSGEVSFHYDISPTVGIDLSDNMLRGNVPDGLFGLRGLEYLNLSYNVLEGRVPGLGKMWNLRYLDLSHNSFSGKVPGNISSLHNLTVLDLSYNCFSGIVTKKQGYWKFPGALSGNPNLCIESCGKSGLPEAPRNTFEEMVEGPISVWMFCISAFVSFYFGVVALFCSARTRNYILQTKC